MPSQMAIQVVARVMIVVTFVALAVVNMLGSSNVVCGASNATVSREYPTPITPSGYAFSIWGLIFFLQAVFSVCALTPVISNRTVLCVGLPLVAAWWLEISWTFLFDCRLIVAQSMAIVGSLVAFVAAYVMAWWMLPDTSMVPVVIRKVGAIDPETEPAPLEWLPKYRNFDEAERAGTPVKSWFVWLEIAVTFVPTSINTAWVLAAAQIGFMVALTPAPNDDGTTNMISDAWGVIAILIAAAGACAAAVIMHDPFFPATVAWAVVAVEVAQGSRSDAILWTGIVALVLAAAAGAYALLRRGLQLWNWHTQRVQYSAI